MLSLFFKLKCFEGGGRILKETIYKTRTMCSFSNLSLRTGVCISWIMIPFRPYLDACLCNVISDNSVWVEVSKWRGLGEIGISCCSVNSWSFRTVKSTLKTVTFWYPKSFGSQGIPWIRTIPQTFSILPSHLFTSSHLHGRYQVIELFGVHKDCLELLWCEQMHIIYDLIILSMPV